MNSQLENTINKTHSSPVMLLHMPWSHLDQSPLQEALQNIFFFFVFLPSAEWTELTEGRSQEDHHGCRGCPDASCGSVPSDGIAGKRSRASLLLRQLAEQHRLQSKLFRIPADPNYSPTGHMKLYFDGNVPTSQPTGWTGHLQNVPHSIHMATREACKRNFPKTHCRC